MKILNYLPLLAICIVTWSAVLAVKGAKFEFVDDQDGVVAISGGVSCQKQKDLEVGKETCFSVGFLNAGDEALLITCEDLCTCIDLVYPTAAIPAGQRKTLTIKFTPEKEGSFEHKVTIRTNETPKIGRKVTIKGKAVKAKGSSFKD